VSEEELVMNMKGTAALVTGGSRGLGAALGRRLAEAGARVVLVARREDALREVVGAIRTAGGEAHGVVADVGDPSRLADPALVAERLVALLPAGQSPSGARVFAGVR
jgi:NAD(P)-dependent dehydrogenase (short-subunit alcohol dehydrogenase family)